VTAVEPKVQGSLVQVQFDPYYTGGSGPELLSDFFFMVLIRYSNLYIIIIKLTLKKRG
jgi:hypothetical protein